MPRSAKDHYQGKKLAGKHTTMINAADRLVRAADGCCHISKISLGHIRRAKSSGGRIRIKVRQERAGLRVTVRGSAYVQDIFLYTKEHRPAIDSLRESLLAEIELKVTA